MSALVELSRETADREGKQQNGRLTYLGEHADESVNCANRPRFFVQLTTSCTARRLLGLHTTTRHHPALRVAGTAHKKHLHKNYGKLVTHEAQFLAGNFSKYLLFGTVAEANACTALFEAVLVVSANV